MKQKTKNAKVKTTIKNSKVLNFCVVVFLPSLFLFTSLIGCEAFVRKFTRKPKEVKTEEPVIEPQSYPDVAVGRDELYKEYFLFWETWVDELVVFLNEGSNFKKQKECAVQALDNLLKMQSLLNEAKAKELDVFILDFTKIREAVLEGKFSGADFSSLRNKIERIKSKVRHSFVFSKIRRDLR